MSNRTKSENSDSISLFPFLAVLLCTMGALLVLLVVLVDRAAKRGVLTLENRVTHALAQVPDDREEITALQNELAELTSYQEKIAHLEAEGNSRTVKQRARLEQVEASARELEKELAKLAVASMQLDQAKEKRVVDEQQAEAEAEHLEKLVAQAEDQVEEMREAGTGSKSFAVVPYKGTNGTFRKPVYIECDEHGAKILPEGIVLKQDDFAASWWVGNPLASVLRATREYHNAQAMQTGETEPPDPYPLLIVRPSGIEFYMYARRAITAWDSDYGYEFVEEDTRLTYRDLPDPLLAQAQEHALMVARERQYQIAQAAPRRFRGVTITAEAPESTEAESPTQHAWSVGANAERGAFLGDGRGSSDKFTGNPNSASFDGGLETSGSMSNPDGDATSLGNIDRGAGTTPGELSASNGGQPGGGSGFESGEAAGQQTGLASSSQNRGGSAIGENLAANSSAQPAGASAPAGNSMKDTNPSLTDSQRPGLVGGPNGTGISPSQTETKPKEGNSIAQTQGRNWAVSQKERHAIPIQRRINVAIHPGQMSLLPEEYNLTRATEKGVIISLEQSSERIAAEFSEALHERVEQWGIAGSGMFWKPVLDVSVGPGGNETALLLQKLLENSGVEVILHQTTLRSTARPVQEGILR